MSIASGDMAALSELYDLFGAELYGLITAAISDKATADRLLNEVFQDIWKNARNIHQQSENISTWLKKRCLVLCLVTLRNNKSLQRSVSQA